MTRDEPATTTQVGAVIAEFDRLGVTDRTERLAITAALLDLEGLGSTTDLVMGQAGRLIAMLRSIQERGELLDLAAPAIDDGQADEQADDNRERITWAEAIARIITMLHTAFGETGQPIPEPTLNNPPTEGRLPAQTRKSPNFGCGSSATSRARGAGYWRKAQ